MRPRALGTLLGSGKLSREGLLGAQGLPTGPWDRRRGQQSTAPMPLDLPLAPALSGSKPCRVTGLAPRARAASSRQSWSRLVWARGTPIGSLRNVVGGTPSSGSEVRTAIRDISAVAVTCRAHHGRRAPGPDPSNPEPGGRGRPGVRIVSQLYSNDCGSRKSLKPWSSSSPTTDTRSLRHHRNRTGDMQPLAGSMT